MSVGRLVIVSGVSGAGKTLALQTLEDIGYFCIDNLPPSMLGALRERVATGQRVAVVVDTRSGEPLEDAEQTALQMRAEGMPVEVLFLDCADEVLVRRFKETRRPHPLANREPSLPKAIRTERALLAPLKAIADHTLDTTLFKPQDLREAIRSLYADSKAQSPLRVRIVSFGFKYGVPADADLVFDVRFLRNPHYVPHLKPKPGTDAAVRDYVLGDTETQEFLETMRGFLEYLLPRYEREGKAYLTVGIGCTGGRHRSVVLSESLGQWFAERGYRAVVEHRDLGRGEEA
ncbi:MAG: RNase adapter RapZ [Fimbriimonadales bacterium]|nr:MAG: RNase adaptor protein RapZ [Fimbriimonadales bacterium]